MNWFFLCCCTAVWQINISSLQVLATLVSQKSTNDISPDSMDTSCAPGTGFTCLTVFVIFPNAKLAHSGASNATSFASVLSKSMETLTTRQTIKEQALLENPNMIFPENTKLPTILTSNNNDNILITEHIGNTLKDMVSDSITRVLNFYNAQMHQTAIPDVALALMFLKGIEDKHGKVFQNKFPLNEWIHESCERVKINSISLANFCHSISRQWKNRSGQSTKLNRIYWKEPEILEKNINEMDNHIMENIGNEPEEIWSLLNIQCQIAVGSRCELPLACERTFLDPTPRSQYMLTHQVLMRMFIDSVNCPSLKSFVTDDKTYTNFCSKMFMEAKYLDVLSVPILYRDLFAEIVGFCGLLGYTNFFRTDWIENILSWQSKSDNGCFLKDYKFPDDILTNDLGLMRQATKDEVEQDVMPIEKCLPHLTVVNLIALSAYWDYLMDG